MRVAANIQPPRGVRLIEKHFLTPYLTAMNAYYFLLLITLATVAVAVISRLRFAMARRRLLRADRVRNFIKSSHLQSVTDTDDEDNYYDAPFLQIERKDHLLRRVERLRSLHSDDEELLITFSMPEPYMQEALLALMNLEPGSPLKLEKGVSAHGHTIVNVVCDGLTLGAITVADDSPLYHIMSSGRISGIYYAGFSGEELPMPSLVVYYVEKRESKRFAPSMALIPALSAAGLLFTQN